MRWITTWIACCMVACALNAYAQEWERLSQFAPSDRIADLEYLDDGRVVAVGDAGCIVLSDDLGNTWRSAYSGTAVRLSRAKFVGSFGWAIGEQGTIVHTRDRGETWEPQFCTSTNNLRGLDFVDSLHGYIVGERGHYFHTSDGGETWSGWSEGADEHNDLLGVAFRDSQNGVAVGGYSRTQEPRILVTTNGGLTWEVVHTSVEGWLADVEFLSNDTFVAVGRHHMILRSTSNGNSWTVDTTLYDDSLEAFRSVEFFNSQYGLTVSDRGLVMRTFDGGLTWDSLTTGGSGISFEFVNQDTVLSSGIGLRISTNGGAAWTPTAEIPTGNFIDADFLSDNFGWILLDKNKLWKTIDGSTWSEATVITPDTLTAIDFIDEQTGFAVAGRNVIYKTFDGGLTWEARDPGTHYPIHQIAFVNSLVGWAVGDAATIVGTTDGGESWTLQATDGGGFLTTLGVLDEHHAWAIGAGSTLLRTTDGATWEMLPQIEFEDFYGLKFLDEQHGIAVGGDGAVFRTTDGGETWTGEHLPMTTLFSVEFANSLDGWIGGENGNIYRTLDGGETWHRLESNSVHHVKDLWVSPTRGWAVGIAGTILRSDYVLPASDTRATLPRSFSLSIFPNPFNSTATLHFEIPRATRAEIVLYDVLGREAMKLADDVFAAGTHSLSVNAENLATGVYFAELRTPEYSTTQKLLLLR